MGKNWLNAFCFAVPLLNCFTALGQDTTDYALEAPIEEDTDWVEYKGGFDFREGIYRTWKEFRMNAPSLPLASLVNSEGQSVTDLHAFEGRLFVVDSSGARQRVAMDRTWGYCTDDAVYMATRNGFQRIIMLGSLCHMMVEEWQVGMGMGIEATPVRIQRILDMRTGSFEVFNASSLGAAIIGDHVLYDEFMAIPARKRNRDEVLFQFLRKYNQRNPLRFPPS
ncbi:MAG: hypothetical protein WAU70_01930 [Flavobacteriales bacterium]